MPQAGDLVKSGDFPADQYKRDSTTSTGHGSGHSDYESISPEVAVTFIANSAGKAKVTAWGGLRVSSGTARAMINFEVREDDSSGTVVHPPSSNPMFSVDSVHSSYQYGGGSEFVQGLTPGATYFARIMTRASTNATEYDFSDRAITVEGKN